jgi:diguanylate cyclase (GGDEF)-like protein
VFHVVDDDNGCVAPNLAALVLNEKPVPALDRMTLISKTGERFAIKDTATPIRDPSNRINGVVLVIRDISKERELAAEITYQATHDALTGLVNRREFHHRLDMALQLACVDGHQHSLLYTDLDQFKIVNDTCGHSAGDELLRQLSTVMRAQLRSVDTVARLGGDEFGVLLPYCPRDAALEIADSIRESIKEFDFVWANNVFPMGASIGLVTFGNDGATVPDLLRMADTACYVAKDRGRNRIHMYAEDDRELERRKGEMGWAARLQRALNDQRFVLYSQKIVALQSDDASQNHYEVLVRLLDEAGNLVPPHPLCAINLSGTTISDDSFLGFLRAELERHQVPPEGLCFRDHRNRGGRKPGASRSPYGRIKGHEEPDCLGRFRQWHVIVCVPETSSRRLPEDRWGFRQGYYEGPDRPRDGGVDQPYWTRHGHSHRRRICRK